jgi:thioredoxin 1
MDEVTEATFEDEILSSRTPVIVDFWAPLCRPCDSIEPHLHAIAGENPGRVRLMRLNVEENLGLLGHYGILSVPTVILFAEGEPRATIVGAQSRDHYERAFAPFIA